MTPDAHSDQVLLEHIRECITRIQEYTDEGRSVFYEALLVQDAVVRNLQVLSESTQRLSDILYGGPGGGDDAMTGCSGDRVPIPSSA